MMAALITTAGTSFGQGAVEALVADRFAEEDARTKARLDRAVKVLGRCRYCGAHLRDRTLVRSPGVCGKKPCKRRAALEPDPVEPPPRPSIEEVAAAVTLRMTEAVEPPERPGREVAGPRDRPAVAAHQSPGAPATPPRNDEDEIMPESEETGKKLCTKCGTTPIRRDNKSGICQGCRKPWKKNGAMNGATHAAPRPAAKNGTTHACDPTALSDDDLALCIAEARARVRSRERLAEILAGEG